MVQLFSINSVFLGRLVVFFIAIVAISTGIAVYNTTDIAFVVAALISIAAFLLLLLGYRYQVLSRKVEELQSVAENPDSHENALFRRLDSLALKLEQLNNVSKQHGLDKINAINVKIQTLEFAQAELSKRLADQNSKPAALAGQLKPDKRKVVSLRSFDTDGGPENTIRQVERPPSPSVDPAVPLSAETVSKESQNIADLKLEPKKVAGIVHSPELQSLAVKKLELNLQPIVNLHNREPVFYRALHCDLHNARTIIDTETISRAEDNEELATSIDYQLIDDAFRMLRVLDRMDRKTGLFCQIAVSTLKHFNKIQFLLESNRAFSDSLILAVNQTSWNVETASRLSRVAELGYSLCLNNITDTGAIGGQALFSSGIRFAQIPAVKLLGERSSQLVQNLGNTGIVIIGSDIEHEYQFLDLVELNLTLGIGSLFSQPRPVKAELLNSDQKATG